MGRGPPSRLFPVTATDSRYSFNNGRAIKGMHGTMFMVRCTEIQSRWGEREVYQDVGRWFFFWCRTQALPPSLGSPTNHDASPGHQSSLPGFIAVRTFQDTRTRHLRTRLRIHINILELGPSGAVSSSPQAPEHRTCHSSCPLV